MNDKCACHFCNNISERVPISSFNTELKHAEWFFNGYSCSRSHVLLKCLKCGEVMKTDYCESHIAQCYFKRLNYSEGAVEFFLLGNNKNYIDLYDVTRSISHAFCLDLDYNDPEIIQLFDEKTNQISYKDMNVFTTFLRLLIRQTPSCYFCGFYYDCFPTELVFVKHMELRCRRGC